MFHNIKFRLHSAKIIWIFFFEAATNRKSSNELNTILTICNLFDFHNLSIEFGYKDCEDQIQSFIENYRIQNGDIKSISNFTSLNQSFFHQFISLQINSILDDIPNELDELSSSLISQIFSKSNFFNMSNLCMYLIHRYQNHLELNMHDEIDLAICLFLFVDASNLPENLIEQLIPISELPIFQMP